MRSPSTIGPALVAASVIVLVAPLVSVVLHFLHDVPIISISSINSSFNLQYEAMTTFPRIVASGLVFYIGACFHCVGHKLLEESG